MDFGIEYVIKSPKPVPPDRWVTETYDAAERGPRARMQCDLSEFLPSPYFWKRPLTSLTNPMRL